MRFRTIARDNNKIARMRVQFCASTSLVDRDKCTAQKYFCTSCPQNASRGRNRSKTSESVPTDSRRHAAVAVNFCADARAEHDLRREFCSRARHRARDCRTAPKLRCKCARRAARVRARVSFSGVSLTACGLALPPDAFITWPTNQPIAFGLVLASATLSGFLAMMSSTVFSIAPSVGDLLHAALLDDVRAGRRLRSRRSRTDPWRSCRKSCRRAIRSRMAPSCAARHRRGRDVLALFIEPAEQFVDHPIGGGLGVAPFGDRFEIVGGLALGHQDAGVIGRERKVAHEARLLLVGQFGQLRFQLVDVSLPSNSSGSRSGSGK